MGADVWHQHPSSAVPAALSHQTDVLSTLWFACQGHCSEACFQALLCSSPIRAGYVVALSSEWQNPYTRTPSPHIRHNAGQKQKQCLCRGSANPRAVCSHGALANLV